MHDSCVFTLLNWLCASRIGLGWAYDTIFFACHMFMHSLAYVLSFQYILIYLNYFGTFLSVSFFPLHSLVYISALWHQNVSLPCPRTLFVLGHLLHLLIPPPLLFGSVMSKPERTSWRTSLVEVFIQNTKSFGRTSPTPTYPLSFTVRVGSHYVTSQSPVHSCWSRSFTPICVDLIIKYLFLLLTFEVHA